MLLVGTLRVSTFQVSDSRSDKRVGLREKPRIRPPWCMDLSRSLGGEEVKTRILGEIRRANKRQGPRRGGKRLHFRGRERERENEPKAKGQKTKGRDFVETWPNREREDSRPRVPVPVQNR